MSISISSFAITAAINSSWDQAIALNQKILKENPSDIPALNRLAFAYFERGNIRKAQQFYRRVLSFDPYNHIASKNLKKINEFRCKKLNRNNKKSPMLTSVFLEEPGKTKVVGLVKLASKSILSQLRPGDILKLCPKKHTIMVEDCQNIYVGVIPDDLSFRLLKFIKAGNKYDAFVRSVSKNSLLIFLRETFRSQRFKNVSSFVTKLENCRFASKEKITKEDVGTGLIEEETTPINVDSNTEEFPNE